uniref:Putative conserved plasma membrane protein n=1 Tax=Tabanus bromius TaxID=304241 RepID=A0A0K8TRE5_TABBR
MTNTKKILHSFTKEFKRDNCGFSHSPPDDLVKSQWQKRTSSIFYVIYRWILALFFTGATITAIVNSKTWHFIIYLTNWGILLCFFTCMLGAILVTIWHFHPEYSDRVAESKEMPSVFKVYWGMHNTTLSVSIVITIVYWSILYNGKEVSATNLLTHAFNSVFMFIDLWIVAYPTRLLHTCFPIALGITYTIFSAIYWACGGTDPVGNHYIYNVLDWEKPGNAIVTVVGVMILCCFIYFCIFVIYKIRVFIYKRFFRDVSFVPTTQSTIGPSSLVIHPSGISMVLGNYGHENPAFTQSTDKIAS